MGHCYGVIGASGAHVVYDNCRGVVVCDITDFLPVSAIPRSYQRHPRGVWRGRREPDVSVAPLSVLQEGRHQDQTSSFFLRGVLAIPTALGFLRPHLRRDGVQVGDVNESCVPLLLLCNREVQAQQVDEAKRHQPRRESQTAASSDEGRCHCGAAAALFWEGGWMASSVCPPPPPPQRRARIKPSFRCFRNLSDPHNDQDARRQPEQAKCEKSLSTVHHHLQEKATLCCCSPSAVFLPRPGLARCSSARALGVDKMPLTDHDVM